jgi:DNA-directed RNA polymerase subunit RPC12/RpoP
MNRDILIAAGFTKEIERADAGLCTTCGSEVTGFDDALSQKEFGISGMCQTCQDKVFGSEEDY